MIIKNPPSSVIMPFVMIGFSAVLLMVTTVAPDSRLGDLLGVERELDVLQAVSGMVLGSMGVIIGIIFLGWLFCTRDLNKVGEHLDRRFDAVEDHLERLSDQISMRDTGTSPAAGRSARETGGGTAAWSDDHDFVLRAMERHPNIIQQVLARWNRAHGAGRNAAGEAPSTDPPKG